MGISMADLDSRGANVNQSAARSGNPTGESRFSERPDGKDAERERLQKKAANKAQEIWEAAEAAPPDHPYFVKKSVKPNWLRQQLGPLKISGIDCDGALIVPVYDAENVLRSLQFITREGDKLNLPGGRKAGCFYPIGKLGKVVVIAEGYATAASCHEACGHATAVAFDAGNLTKVAEAIHETWPHVAIIIAADNDVGAKRNAGVEAAHSAARAVGGLVAIPELDGGKCDFNDLMHAKGLDAVRAAIEAASAPLSINQKRPEGGLTVRLRRASEMTMEPVNWLWPDWLARGKFHVLAGPPGLGKTSLVQSLATIVTRGGVWPDGSRCQEPGNVLVWSGEDDPVDTLLPRFAAMGADMSRVVFVDGLMRSEGGGSREAGDFDPARDMPLLTAQVAETGDVRLLMIDPVSQAVAGDSNKNAEVRRALAPLFEFARECGAAVMGISHFTKNSAERHPIDRVTGSLAFAAAPRIVLVAASIATMPDGGEKEDQRQVLVRVKSNIGPSGGAFVYQVEQVDLGREIRGSRILWGNYIEGSAQQILAQVEQTSNEWHGRSVLAEAISFLSELLASGPLPAKQVYSDANDAGHQKRTIDRAKKQLRVESVYDRQTQPHRWLWRLPQTGSQNTTSGNLGILGNLNVPAGTKDDNIAKDANNSIDDSAGIPGDWEE
jgi:putative DNA primase/helicase